MSRKLPIFSFKKYLGSEIIDVENINTMLDNIIKIIRSSHSSTRKSKENIILIVLTLYEGDWEIRVWAENNNYIIITNIDNNYNKDNIYKILIEFFETNRLLMLTDIEASKNYGFNALILDNATYAMLKRALENLMFKTETVDNKKQITKETTVSTYKTLDWKQVIQNCLDMLWDSCFKFDCVKFNGSLSEILENMKIMAFSKDSEYLCIIKELDDCEYAIVWNQENSVLSECREFDEIAIAIESALKRGYEPLIQLNENHLNI